MNFQCLIKRAAVGFAVSAGLLLGPTALAASTENGRIQFIPMFTFKTGPAAALGIATNAGYLDYWQMLNLRDGGIGGVKLIWEECETERKVEKGLECYEKLKNKGPTGATFINPIATDIAYALLKKTREDKIPMMTGGYGRTDTSDGSVFPYVFPIGTNYWSMNTAIVRYIGMRLGGVSRLQGKTLVNLHHGSAFGRETKEILDLQAERYGFKIVHIEVPVQSGKDQDEIWKNIVSLKPDWVILRGIGVMNPTAMVTAHKYGYPVSRMIGITWAGAEADVIPAGAAAKGYIAAALSLPGTNFPVIQDIIKNVYRKGKGNLPDASGIGSTYYNRGVSGAILVAEAIRTAQGKFGKRPLTGEEVRWGMEHINLSDRRIAELGAFGVSQPLRMSCNDHEGGGTIRFQRWNGKEWRPVTGWIEGDQSIVRPMIEKSAAAYAAKEGFAARNCAQEDPRQRLAGR